MKKINPVLSILTLVSLACSLSGLPFPVGETTIEDPTASPVTLLPAAPIDPRLLDTAGMEECSIFIESDLAAVLYEAPIDRVPEAAVGETACYYSFASGKTFSLSVTVDTPGRQAYDGVMQFLDVAEGTQPVALGEVAVIKEKDGQVYFDAVFNGWYISMQGYGFPPEAYLTLAQWLSARFTPFTPVADVSQPTVETAAPASGTLVDMQVTIEMPAEMAGTTTLAALNAIGFLGFSMCSTPSAVPFIVTFSAPPATQPPTPVGVFSITAENGVIAGQPSNAVISIGLGPSDIAQMSNWQGTVIVAPDGTSGTFEAPGQVKGSWVCVFAP